MIDCHYSGLIGAPSGAGYIGGLCGSFYGKEISKCSADLNIDVENGGYIGGLFASLKCDQISECWFKGNLKGIMVVGGIAGGMMSGVNASNLFARGSVISNDIVGGLFGELNEIYNGLSTTLTNCYAASVVTCTSEAESHGGTIGTSDVINLTVSSCYYDSQVSGQSDNDGRGVPKTTPQMKTGFTFVDWDFETIWGIKSTENDGYPFFGVGDPQPDMPTQLCSFSNSYSFAKIS